MATPRHQPSRPARRARSGRRSARASADGICRSWSERRVCTDCPGPTRRPALLLPQRGLRLPSSPTLPCVRAARALASKTPLPVERCVAALDYEFLWDTLQQRFKYQGAGLARLLAERLLQALESAGYPPRLHRPSAAFGQRLAERGYNQAHEWPNRLGRRLRLRVEPSLVLRLRIPARRPSWTA